MLPLRDVSRTRLRPWFTLALIGAGLFIYFGVQATLDEPAHVEFLYERAVVACEVTTGQPLSTEEIRTQDCRPGSGDPVFPEKDSFIAALTSMFLHGNAPHVLFNMWFLWIFGNNVEEAFGRLRYLLLYLAGGLAATGTFIVMNPQSAVPLVGASGAIATVLGAYVVLFPSHQVITWVGWLILPLPAAIFLGVWFLGQFVVQEANVAWEAHVGGFLFGFVVALIFRKALLRRVRRLHGGQIRW